MSSTNTPHADDATPPPVDTSTPSIARVYDAGLGGKDNFESDREVLRHLGEVAPEIGQFTWDHRNMLVRMTRFLAGHAEITQFLDCGSGLPTAENTHQVAQRMQPTARVVYVDNDPAVRLHGEALVGEVDNTFFSPADIFEPDRILTDDVVRENLDFSQPMALYQLGTLHHYNGRREPADIMREYIDALPSGSYVALSHFLDPQNEYSEIARRLEEMFAQGPLGSGWFRPQEEILEMFVGLQLVEPGLVRCVDWWPDGPRLKPLLPSQYCIVGGIGYKP